jgi:hypothetical protein
MCFDRVELYMLKCNVIQSEEMDIGNQATNKVDGEVRKMSSDVTSTVDGVWQTTHLDIMIGDLQRGTTCNSSIGTDIKDQVLTSWA